MTAGELIAAVTANQGDRNAARRIGQSGQQVEARLIRPLQVIEEQRYGAAAAAAASTERTARPQPQGLARPAGRRLGHQLRENSRERPTALRTAGRSALATTS